MKKHRRKPVFQITPEAVELYCEQMSMPENEYAKQVKVISEKELEYTDMFSGTLVCGLLQLLIKVSGAKNVLEIGTFTGYSALMMAEALPDDGKLQTIEFNKRYIGLAERMFEKFDTRNIIALYQGDAAEVISSIDPGIDLVFLDADKARYSVYLELILPKLKTGGLLVVDNVLWDGNVLHPEDEKSCLIADFNSHVARDERLEQVMLPVRDGLTIARKK